MGRQRIVVKIGSSSLTETNGSLSLEKLTEHVGALAELKKQGHDVILISSGAVAAGFPSLGYPSRPVTLAGKQAAAAVGQGLLMQGYTEQFAPYSLTPAQLLLTRDDFSDHTRFGNANRAITELLKRGCIPIINENDSTSVDELTFGDNDLLSALVVGFVHADMLIILTDVNGIYSDNPLKNPDAMKYSHIPEITSELLALSGESGTTVGTGGMKSKISAAQTALSLGVNSFIGKGEGHAKLVSILSGEGDGTYLGSFSHKPVMPTSKQWISLHSQTVGSIVIDEGAEHALLQKGKSLLPAGVVSVRGIFSAQEVIQVCNAKGFLLGKGRTNLSSEEISLVKGLDSTKAREITNHSRKEIIHRDQWVAANRKEQTNNE
ncbi:glutamate 5-kinase [Alkalicoccobacillus plakortidis]|uniref:Glutamate 5-kinase n=1 Tax=Alkalicoccobacillus plakortidis TaxID=444060 RepID=A0ABT0XR19_9BACI|nr:glutamate 5-kinase [Alkalicoccobacillus plakortidis]MCM2677742.1 glutamate 5-kinase [Alkalicoccobacillus plakortidis]